jgi:hypothetical protein
MAYQTGTVANLNDLLAEFATFLLGAGWTIVGNWREPMLMSISTSGSPPVSTYHWRWGRRLHVSKGGKFISMQDAYTTKDIVYGTNPGTLGSLANGPLISAAISSSINAQPADHPPGDPPYIGPPSLFPTYPQPGTPGSVNGIVRTVTMPLPSLVGQADGTWRAETGGSESPIDLPAPFGVPGGAALPCRYWFLSDATGDNVIMCALRGGDLSYMPTVSYLYFGDLQKGGPWSGGQYLGACHGNNGAWVTTDTFRANRWGPPGAMHDGVGIHTLLHIEVDTFVGANRYAGLSTNQDPNVWTGRTFSSTTLLTPKPGDPAGGVFGIEQNGVHFGTARLRRSSLYDGAPMWPTYWMILRDNGLYSTLGVLPNIYQADTTGFAPGDDYVAKDGTHYIIFDGFAVKKVP